MGEFHSWSSVGSKQPLPASPATTPHPQLLGLGCPAYPSDKGGIGERGSHVMVLEVVHVVEELCRRLA